MMAGIITWTVRNDSIQPIAMLVVACVLCVMLQVALISSQDASASLEEANK
jgi:archaellin